MPEFDEAATRRRFAIVLNELPIPHDRDDAWRTLQAAGESIQFEHDLALTSQRTIEEVLRNPLLFSSKRAFDALNSPLPLVPLAFDPPEQTRYRRILQPFFSPRAIRPLEAHLRRQVAELLDPIAERGTCEFVSEFADIFPVQTFIAFFGLPEEDLDKFMTWKNAILAGSDASGEANQSGDPQHAVALFTYLAAMVGQRRGVAGDDVLSQLLCLDGEDALTDEEVIGLCFLFVLAGLDTVTGALSLGMERLARNEPHRRELVADPSLVPAAVEELVRLDPPAPFTPRVTTEATTIDGRSIPAGTRVSTYLAVANRDPAVRTDPFEMDFHRTDNAHASFGLGVHRCLGSHLARLEMGIVYEEWHRRFADYYITPGTRPRVRWPQGTLGLESLPLTVVPRG